MNFKLPAGLKWGWLAVGIWAAWFSFHLLRTYTLTELAVILPLGMTVAAGWMLLARKGKLWVRLAVLVLAVVLWFFIGGHSIEARRAAYRFRHFPADTVEEIQIFKLNTGREEDKILPMLMVVDPAKIRALVDTFRSARPCLTDITKVENQFQMVFTEKTGEKINVPIYLHNETSPPTLGILVQWKSRSGQVYSCQYHSPELLRELIAMGLR